MAWTAPATAVTGNTLTAAFWNAQVRDNMIETAAATATTAGDIVYADGANSMGSRVGIGAAGSLLASTGSAPAWRTPAGMVNFSDSSTSQSDTNTTYNAKWGAPDLPSVTVATGTRAVVIVSTFNVFNSTAGASTAISFSVSGATTIAADNVRGGTHESGNAFDRGSSPGISLVTLTAGSNTFQMQARVTGGTGTIEHPRILVIPL